MDSERLAGSAPALSPVMSIASAMSSRQLSSSIRRDMQSSRNASTYGRRG